MQFTFNRLKLKKSVYFQRGKTLKMKKGNTPIPIVIECFHYFFFQVKTLNNKNENKSNWLTKSHCLFNAIKYCMFGYLGYVFGYYILYLYAQLAFCISVTIKNEHELLNKQGFERIL